jgi:hypothetical protein
MNCELPKFNTWTVFFEQVLVEQRVTKEHVLPWVVELKTVAAAAALASGRSAQSVVDAALDRAVISVQILLV